METLHQGDWRQALDRGQAEGRGGHPGRGPVPHNHSGEVLAAGSYKNIFRKYKYNSLQAPSILPETESNIDRSLGQFTKELGQMDTAVKKISDIAMDQANKYKNTMKKDYQVFKSVDVGLCT